MSPPHRSFGFEMHVGTQENSNEVRVIPNPNPYMECKNLSVELGNI